MLPITEGITTSEGSDRMSPCKGGQLQPCVQHPLQEGHHPNSAAGQDKLNIEQSSDV
jgi:hypothetical protein